MRLENARLLDGTLVDLAIDGDRIASVTPAGADRPDAEALDLEGATVLPGLWDEHVHVGQWALYRSRVDLRGAGSPAEAAALLRPSQRGRPVVGVGMRLGMWPTAPTAAELDAVTGDTPAVAISQDVHSTWINTAAARLLGVEPGVLRETPSFEALRRIDGWVDQAERDRLVADALRAASARGVVGIVDLELERSADNWRRRGSDLMRVEAGSYRHDLADALPSGTPLAGLAVAGPFKAITDGSLGTLTAYCHEPYGHPPTTGVLAIGPDELEPLMREATERGIWCAIHAIGDAANALAIDAFERTGARGRIEHAQLLDPADIARMAAVGIGASVQPVHALDDRDLNAAHWPDREHRTYLFRSLVDAGVRVVLGSDAPVAPLDPWLAIDAAVTRRRGDEAPWFPDEGLDLATALACSARTRIAAGEPADLVVATLGDRPAETVVHRTIVAGRTAFAG